MTQLTLTQPGIIVAARKGLAVTSNFIVKQSPIILAGTAIVGVGTTGYLAYKAGLKADEVIKAAEEEKGEPLTTQEKIQTGWKLWIPPVASGVMTVGAIVASSAISQKRQAALAGLYAMSETAMKEYQAKVEEKYGSKKEQEIRDAVNADSVKDDIPPFNPDSYGGKVLVKDRMSGRIFLGDPNKIRAAANELAEGILNGDMCASLNEFYEMIDLESTETGIMCGWNLSHLPKVYFTSALTSDMRPILVLDWDNRGDPIVDYRDI